MAKQTNAKIGFENELWAAADAMRGNVSASDYRKIVVRLIFLKYVSDAFDFRYQELLNAEDYYEGDEEDRDAYIEKNVFFVPETARWSVISSSAHTPEIGVKLDEAMRAIEKENKSLKNVLPIIYASPDIDKRVLGNVVDIFTNIEMHSENEEQDLLGRAYEYFIEKFAALEGKNGGEFYTPSSIVKTIVAILKPFKGRVYDPACGSATTAHAVMQLNADDVNAEDVGNRKFIMVQLPEPTDEKSEAHKAGYMNICEIGKERIRRAGEKIKEKNKDKENIENLDIGFKVLKLDTSNIRKWQPDYDNLEQSLFDYVDNYMEGRTELDVVYEIMLKYGLDLTYPVDEFILAQKKVYSIGFGMLMICLDDEITTEVAKGILEKIKELSPESTRVVFKDNGLNSDSNKTNIKEILKCGGIEEFITL